MNFELLSWYCLKYLYPAYIFWSISWVLMKCVTTFLILNMIIPNLLSINHTYRKLLQTRNYNREESIVYDGSSETSLQARVRNKDQECDDSDGVVRCHCRKGFRNQGGTCKGKNVVNGVHYLRLSTQKLEKKIALIDLFLLNNLHIVLLD